MLFDSPDLIYDSIIDIQTVLFYIIVVSIYTDRENNICLGIANTVMRRQVILLDNSLI